MYIDNTICTSDEQEAELASNCYLISLISTVLGVSLPIVNIIAAVILYLSSRKFSYFARWHCTQILLSQSAIAIINAVWFCWTLSIVFAENTMTNAYIAYLILIVFLNLIDFIATIFSAIRTRKGICTEWFFWGAITNLICKTER